MSRIAGAFGVTIVFGTRCRSDGLVTLTVAGRELARASQVSSCRDSTPPLRGRFGSEDPQRRSGDQVALKIEVVVDGSVDAEEALGRSG